MITIAIVENNNTHLNITANYITNTPQYKLLTTAINGFEMVRFCYSSRQLPDIALIDIEMQVMDGISLIDFLTRFFPSIKCIANTNHCHKEIFEDAMCCGAMGLISKTYLLDNRQIIFEDKVYTRFGTIDECIETVMKNEFCIEGRMMLLAKVFLHQLNRDEMLAMRERELAANAIFGLTNKEWEIATLCGSSSATIEDIAGVLSIAPKTLQGKLAYIYEKLGISNRMELMRFCSSKALVKYARELLGKEKEV